jgi:hypothetical protein
MKTEGFDPKFPILTWKGKIIDGRHRYLASQEAGVEPVIRKLADSASLEDAVGEVTKANMLRRQLSVAERAMVAEKLANMSADGFRGNQYQKVDSPNLDYAPVVSLADAAKRMNVSRASVAEVRKIKNEAPEVYAKLERGEIKSINTASKEAFKPVAKVVSVTPKGVGTTLISVLRNIDEDLDADEVIDCVLRDLSEMASNPKTASLARARAQSFINQMSTLERLSDRLRGFLEDTPQSQRIN